MARKINELNDAEPLSGGDYFHIQQSGIDRKLDLQSLFDMFFPVGMTYTQYPDKPGPGEMGWLGTWTNVSAEYAGDFFRAEGGNALAFESGEQSDAFQGHRHNVTIREGDSGGNDGPGRLRRAHDTSPVTHYSGDPTSDGVNGTPRTANETRPVNKTIRIWERTA